MESTVDDAFQLDNKRRRTASRQAHALPESLEHLNGVTVRFGVIAMRLLYPIEARI
jgi:hypothetical protein